MRCPACSNVLTPESIGGIEIDVCDDGCAGIWFDNHELEKLRKAILDDGAASPGVTPAPNPAVNEGRRRCPRCDVVMMRHRHPDGRDVVIDRCPRCNGTWLDEGEFQIIERDAPESQKQRANREERRKKDHKVSQARLQRELEEQRRAQRRSLSFVLFNCGVPGF